MRTISSANNWARVARSVLPFLITKLRIWDQVSSMRVDHFIANSPVIAERIRKYYRAMLW